MERVVVVHARGAEAAATAAAQSEEAAEAEAEAEADQQTSRRAASPTWLRRAKVTGLRQSSGAHDLPCSYNFPKHGLGCQAGNGGRRGHLVRSAPCRVTNAANSYPDGHR
jgi:hypothetical protein